MERKISSFIGAIIYVRSIILGADGLYQMMPEIIRTYSYDILDWLPDELAPNACPVDYDPDKDYSDHVIWSDSYSNTRCLVSYHWALVCRDGLKREVSQEKWQKTQIK